MDYSALGNTCICGLQWGDEGKGKIVDLLTEHFDVVVRFAGGANAGHTVIIGDDRFALHLLPSGILRPGVLNVIGPGVAVDPEILVGEIDALRRRGIPVGDNLLVSRRASLVTSYHKKQDRLDEAKLSPDRKIGTTAKGIGPCYADKMRRSSALRVADLYEGASLRRRLAEIVDEKNKVFAALYDDREPLDARSIGDEFLSLAEALAPFVADTTQVLMQAVADGRRILFEGAQGSLLDVTHGTFPFVTSSTCTAAGAAAGAGVPPGAIRDYIGVIKAYSTRVGGGPFPTEVPGAVGEKIRQRGNEFGTTTGRPRRCGWFDAFAVRYAIGLSGITQLAVMHLDTLSTFDELKICTGYRLRGEPLSSMPATAAELDEVAPVFETLPGWREEIGDVRDDGELPAAARSYLDRLEAHLATPVTLVSVGAERTATLHRRSSGAAGFRAPPAAERTAG